MGGFKGERDFAVQIDYATCVSNSQLNHIRKGGHITTATINKLCKLLNCEIGDIVAYVPDGDEKEQEEKE